jgi:PAS domain S-box-containing protein
LLRWLLDPWLGDSRPLATLYGAVTLAVWVGGYRHGILASALGYIVCDLLFMAPRAQVDLSVISNRLGLAMYLLSCALIIGLGEAMRKAQRRAQESLKRLEEEVAQRRLAEEQLRSSFARSELLARFLQDSSQPFAVGSPDGRLTFCNEAFIQLTGYTEEELRSTSWATALTPPEWREHEARVLEQLHQTGEPQLYQKEYLRKNGTRVPLEIKLHLAAGTEHQPGCYYAFVTDVTERKRVESALRESEQQFRRVVDNSPDIISRIDRSHRHVFVSAAVKRATGFEPERFLGKTNAEMGMPEELCREWEEKLEEGFRTGKPMTMEFEYPSPGGVRHYASLLVPEMGADKTVESMLSIARDLTERHKAEQALREREAFLSRVLNSALNGIYLFDLKRGGTVLVNGQFTALTGYSMDQLQAMTKAEFAALFHPDDIARVKAHVRHLGEVADGEVLEADYRFRTADGRWIWCLSRDAVFARGADGSMEQLIGSFLDITARKESEERLESLVAERTAKLRELVGELEHFSYTITHDMRAPVRAMRAFAQAIYDPEEECSDEERRGFVRRIIAGAERLDALIADALDYSKAVREELPLEPVDVGRLLRGMMDSYPEFQAAHADIHIQGGIPLVLGNRAGLTQCFSNLLSNAVKFVKPGAKAQVQVRAEYVNGDGKRGPGDPSGAVRIWVEDQGIGISKAMLPRIFGMFSRGASPQAGTGIGLALVRKVVDRMGGKVGVQSQEGQGSRFWVELRTGDVRGAPAGFDANVRSL